MLEPVCPLTALCSSPPVPGSVAGLALRALTSRLQADLKSLLSCSPACRPLSDPVATPHGTEGEAALWKMSSHLSHYARISLSCLGQPELVQKHLDKYIVESQNGSGWKGPLEATQSNPPAVRRDIFSWIRVLRAPSTLAWNVPRDGASPTSLGNLCQGFANLSVKYFFLISSLISPLLVQNHCSLSYRNSPVKKPVPISLISAPFMYWKAAIRSPLESSLLQAEQPQLSQPFLTEAVFQPSGHRCGPPDMAFAAIRRS